MLFFLIKDFKTFCHDKQIKLINITTKLSMKMLSKFDMVIKKTHI